MAKKQKRSINNPAVPLTGKSILDYLGDFGQSRTGVSVTPKTAMTVSPVWQAIDVITSDISRTPFLTYRESKDGGKERAIEHPVYRLLRRSVGDMTSNLWIARILGHALLYGNGYSRVHWRGSRIQKLEWLHRDWVEVVCEDGRMYYMVRYPRDRGDRIVRVPKAEMFHLVGLTLDDLGGLSLVDYARSTIGRQIAAEHFQDDFFLNSAVPDGFFTHPGEMSEGAQERFLAAVQRRHGGSGNRHKIGILEEGMTWNQAGINPVDAMLVDQLQFGIKDVARFFNLPPHKLGDESRISYNSLEQEEKAYYSGSLGKWISRFEFEANDKLFVDLELEQGYFTEFLQDSWLKADTDARFNAYAVAISWGIMSRNEVRLRENLNPYEGGDEYLTPLTHQQPADDATDDEEPTPAPAGENVDDGGSQPPADEPAPRAGVLARDELADAVWNAVRHLHNVTTRKGVRAKNFLQFVNSLRVEQELPVRAKVEPAYRSHICDDTAKVADTINAIFAGYEHMAVTASECQPEELRQRVNSMEAPLQRWARQFATDLVFPPEGDDTNED
jgi:HK97 family phage portal protein